MKLIGKATLCLGLSIMLCMPVLGNTTSTSTNTVQANEKTVLTKEEAVNAALNLNNSLSLNSQYNKVLAEQLDNFQNIGSLAYQQTSVALNQNEQQRKFTIDKITTDITKRYDNIVLLELEIKNMEIDIALQEESLKVLETQKKVGLATPLQIKSSQVSLETSKANKKAKEETLVSEKANFKILTNKDLDKYILENTITFEPFRVDNISAFCQSKADTYLKYQQELAEVQNDYMFDTLNLGSTYADYLNAKYNANSAKLNAEDSRDALIQSLMSGYSSLFGLEENINSLQSQIDLLKTQLSTLALQYKVGLVTKLEYDQQFAKLKDLQFNLISLINTYNTTATSLQKPWVN